MIPQEAHKQVALRPFPYPYRAGLAICSDIDGCTKETFLRVHNALNAEQSGLGLPVADSFFGVGRDQGQLAYFQEDGKTLSQDAGFLRDALRHGLVDSIHSWGDFNNHPPEPDFLRPMAENLCREMDRHGIKVPIWINHGTPDNLQNFKARLQPGYAGDDPQSPLYTADLARSMGVGYYWDSELVPWPLSEAKGRGATGVFRRAGLWGKNLAKGLMLQPGKMRSNDQISQMASLMPFRDGSMNTCFPRYNNHPQGLWGLPTRHTLRYTLNSVVLNDLEEHGGCLIIYTHLGLPRYTGPPLFPIEDFTALLNLTDRYAKGRIWVAPTSQLLDHWSRSHSLEWEATQKQNTLVIEIMSFKDRQGNPILPVEENLAGLCFYTPEPDRTVFRLRGVELRPTINGKDHTGRSCVGFSPLNNQCLDLLEE